MIKNTKKNKKIKVSTKSSNNSMEYNPIQEDYDENAKTRMFNKKIANNEDTILALRNKVKMLENKTNRLQSMNEIFLDLLKNQQKINKQHIKQNPEFIQIGGSVGFNAYSFPSTLYDSKESLADRVFCHILSTSSLWKTVRMAGGAYGVYLFPSADSGITKFLTYRDPHPFESLKALGSCIEEAINRGVSKEETEKAIIGCYSDEVTPKSPSGRGSTGFLRCLYGMDEKQKVKRIKTLLSITSKDLMQAALRYKENIAKGRNVILFGDSANLVKAAENTGKIINIKI